MRGTTVLFGLAVASLTSTFGGCTGDISAGAGDDDDGADAGPASVAFTAPAAGSEHLRDYLADDGWLVADVPVEVDVTGADSVEILADGVSLGEVGADGALLGLVRPLGAVTLTARARRGDEVVGEATLAVTTADPVVSECLDWLDLYQLDYELGPDNEGVTDPVTLTTPINGMVHRYSANDAPRSTFFMSCELARSLARAAPMLRARGVVEVVDMGVYNYRCINNNGTPPDCPDGISQHAYAKAFDIAGFTVEGGAFYSVNDDWVIDPDAEDTCAAPTEPGADAFLHDAICELKTAGVWNIVLTPNYNSAHRNHFHVDLTPGADFIEHGHSGLDVGPDDL